VGIKRANCNKTEGDFILDSTLVLACAAGLCLLSARELKSQKQKHGIRLWDAAFAALFFAAAVLLFAQVLDASILGGFFATLFGTTPWWALIALAVGEELFFRGLARRLLGTLPSLLLYCLLAPLLYSAGFGQYLATAVFLLAVGGASTYLVDSFGLSTAVLFRLAAVVLGVATLSAASLPLALLILCAPIWYEAGKRVGVKKALDKVGLHFKDGKLASEVLVGLVMGIVCFALIQIEGLALTQVGLQDTAKVAQIISTQTPAALVVVVLLSPIGEEVLFRGFLQKRYGVVLTSVLFTILHYGYGSVAELAAAFTVSLAFGWFVRQRKQHGIIPTIIAHMLLNALAICAVFIH
jgi:membrane protease YdiL (CAAX protease family)